jgi:hypothetical protein
MIYKVTIILCLLIITACGKNNASGTDKTITPTIDYKIYASPVGFSSGKGTLVSPLDIKTAITKAVSRDTIVLRGGVYSLSTKITINTSGVAGKPIAIVAYSKDAARPVLDFSALSRNTSSARVLILVEVTGTFMGLIFRMPVITE